MNDYSEFELKYADIAFQDNADDNNSRGAFLTGFDGEAAKKALEEYKKAQQKPKSSGKEFETKKENPFGPKSKSKDDDNNEEEDIKNSEDEKPKENVEAESSELENLIDEAPEKEKTADAPDGEDGSDEEKSPTDKTDGSEGEGKAKGEDKAVSKKRSDFENLWEDNEDNQDENEDREDNEDELK